LKQLKGVDLRELGATSLADLLAGRIPGTVDSTTRAAAIAIFYCVSGEVSEDS
jgi:hypothetical protein